MSRKYFFHLAFLLIILCNRTSAQFQFDIIPNEFEFFDRVFGGVQSPFEDAMYFCGTFSFVDSVRSNCIVKYSNGHLSLTPFDSNLVQHIRPNKFESPDYMLVYDDKILVVGRKGILEIDSGFQHRIIDSNESNIRDFEIHNDTLFLAGLFDSIGGVSAHGLAVYVDGKFYAYKNFDTLMSNHFFESDRCIYNIAFEGDKLVLGGIFTKLDSINYTYGLLQYDGINLDWYSGGNIRLYTLDYINDIIYHDNTLYVGGQFVTTASDGTEAVNIVSWDGAEWSSMNSNLLYTGVSYVTKIVPLPNSNKLFVLGGLLTLSYPTEPVANLAMYNPDEETWCRDTTGMYFLLNMVFYNDTPFVVGRINGVSGATDLKYGIAKITDWSFNVNTSILEPQTSIPLSIYPNPTNSILHISSEMPLGSMSVYDIYGRRVHHTQTRQKETDIDVSTLAPGTYIISAEHEQDIGRGVFIKK